MGGGGCVFAKEGSQEGWWKNKQGLDIRFCIIYLLCIYIYIYIYINLDNNKMGKELVKAWFSGGFQPMTVFKEFYLNFIRGYLNSMFPVLHNYISK